MLAGGNPTAAGSGSGSFGQALASADRWRTVNLGVDDALRASGDIELPVRDVSSIDAAWLDCDESALFRRRRSGAGAVRGRVANASAELWPIDLNDGRRLGASRRTNRGGYVGDGGYQ